MTDTRQNLTSRPQRTRSGVRDRADGPATRRQSVSPLIPLFLLSLATPIYFFVGTLRLSPYRVILVVMFIPCLIAWSSGRCGKKRAADVFLILMVLWQWLALTVNHGFDVALENAGMGTIEALGSYFLARWLIRDRAAFAAMARWLALTIMLTAPFALFESITTRPIIGEFLGQFFSVFPNISKDPRWGLDGAQGPFEHPILYGVFAASGFSLAYYVIGAQASRFVRYARSALIGLAVFCSLSSGPYLDLVLQFFLISWDRLTRGVARRWKVLAGLFGISYIVVDALSNRNPFEVFASYLSFNADTAYGRIDIFVYGMQNVRQHPVFGIGLNTWEVPDWVGTSVDNFWLVIGMGYGVPAFLFLVFAFISVFYGFGRLKDLDEELQRFRKGMVVTLVAISVAAATVHFWNATYSLLLFLVGSGIWMFDEQDASTSTASGRSSARTTAVRRLPPPQPQNSSGTNPPSHPQIHDRFG